MSQICSKIFMLTRPPGRQEWRSFIIKDHIAELVARLSSRVFVGDQLCHDPRWLDITASYTINAFTAADELRMWNPLLRHVVHWFLPRCRKLRAQIKEAYAIMGPVIEARKAQRAYLSENRDQIAGDDPNPEDAIEWFETLSRGRDYDPRLVQLKLSLAAIHTSTDLISQTLLDLAEHPELIGPLRDEIDTVLATDGWTKTAMFKMKLLDSIIKETQRMKPISFST